MKNKKYTRKKRALRTTLPEAFLLRLKKLFGEDVATEIRKTFVRKPITFRVNTLVAEVNQVVAELEEAGFVVSPVSYLENAFILANRSKKELIQTTIYQEGNIYVQSIASMIPPLVLDVHPGETVLDLTAAPGSKTSQLAALMQQSGEFVANELNGIRFLKLEHNMQQQHVVNTEKHDWHFELIKKDGSDLCEHMPEYFEKILLDVPCSGEARFDEKNPKSFSYWGEQYIPRLADRQQTLLLSAWNALKPGGTLVYSTCTMAPEENELCITALLNHAGDEAIVQNISLPGLSFLPTIFEWKGQSAHPAVANTLRIMPTVEVEGFFVAKIQKKK